MIGYVEPLGRIKALLKSGIPVAAMLAGFWVSDANAGDLIILSVDQTLYPEIQTEVQRLETDLIDEGYSAKIHQVPSGTSASNLWSYLRGEYTNTNQNLQGTILIGNLPFARYAAPNDLAYWNMNYFQTNGLVRTYRIWVSRISATPGNYSFGNEAELVKRALDANHYYRKGESRLPHRAYYYTMYTNYVNMATNLLTVWNDVVVTNDINQYDSSAKFMPWRTDLHYGGADALVAGADLFQENSHGYANAYMYDGFRTPDVQKVLAQARWCMLSSCGVGAPGGIAENHILTRGGGCILSAGASGVSIYSDFQVALDGDDQYRTNHIPFRASLAAGDTWGKALLKNYCLSGYSAIQTMIYGDLSMGVMIHPPNELPIITNFTASATAILPGETVDFSFSVVDPDAAATNSPYLAFEHQVEWFPVGFDCGRNDPTYTTDDNAGPGWTNYSYTYPTAGVYFARVEVMDEWRARGWRELKITANSPPTPLPDATSVVVMTSVTFPFLGNDSDPDGHALTVQAIGVPLYGTLVNNGSNLTYYATNSLWTGVDTFDYVIEDSMGLAATGTISVTVLPDTTQPVVDNGKGAVCGYDSATLNGNLTAGPGSTAFICWGDNDGGTTVEDWDHVINLGAYGLRTFSADTTATLQFGSLYYYRAYASNDVGECWAPNTIGFQPLPPATAAIAAWKQSMDIVLTGYTNTAVLTNFPVLLVLSNNVGNSGFTYSALSSPNGYDLRFADIATTDTVLPYDVEVWNTNGVSLIWVRVSELSAGCTIKAYWDNDQATQPEAYTTNGATWSEYAGVWHLADSNVRDASGYGNDGTNYYAVSNVTGKVGNGLEFDASGVTYIGDRAPLDNLNRSLSVSTWIKPEVLSWEDGVVSMGLGTWLFVLKNGLPSIQIGGIWQSSATPVETGTWSLVSFVYDDNAHQLSLYYNGQLDGSLAYTNLPGLNGELCLGRRQWENHFGVAPGTFDGIMDEVRISPNPHSADWQWACYKNQRSPESFASFGAVQHHSNTCQLVIASPYGTPIPPVGITHPSSNLAVYGSIAGSPVLSGATQLVCTGWVGTGSITSGAGTNAIFSVTSDTTLTWQWQTNYWITCLAAGTGSGSINASTGAWYAAGSPVIVTATPDAFCFFDGWSGDTNGASINAYQITIPADGGRNIMASFRPAVTQTNAVPYRWLAAQNSNWATNCDYWAAQDPDGDGFPTWQEYWSGTDPTNAASYLKIDSVAYNGAQITIKWEHARVDAGIPPIVIQGCTNLAGGGWTPQGTKVPANGTNSWSISGPARQFYRLSVPVTP